MARGNGPRELPNVPIGDHCRMTRTAPDEEVFPSERERDRRRDRKRVTAMVVDGAGIRRQAMALAARLQRRSAPPDPG